LKDAIKKGPEFLCLREFPPKKPTQRPVLVCPGWSLDGGKLVFGLYKNQQDIYSLHKPIAAKILNNKFTVFPLLQKLEKEKL